MDDPTGPFERRANRLLWAAWFGFWTLMILVALQDNYWSGKHPLWRPLLWEGSSMLVASALVLWQRHRLPVLRPLLPRPLRWFALQLAWLPLVVLAFVALTYGLRHGVYALLGQTYEHEDWLLLVLYEGSKLAIFFGLWTAAQYGLESFLALLRAQQQMIATERALMEARRALLQAKIQPHFLFNALNTITAVLRSDPDEAERLVAELAGLLRLGLSLDRKPWVSLAEEWQFLQSYATLMLARFAPRVSIDWQFDDGLADLPVPPLVLQPLLENMFKHGAEKTPGAFPIAVRVLHEHDAALITMESRHGAMSDTGREGEGLAQVRERLALAYGADAGLTLENRAQGGVRVTLRLPLADADEA
jgi:hypothetical protein